MPDNIVDIPLSCPVKFFSLRTPEYPSMDNSPWLDQIPDQNRPVQQGVTDPPVYTQKWFRSGTKMDNIVIQITATFGPAKLELLDCEQNVLETYAPSTPSDPAILPGWTVYEWHVTPPVSPQYYYWRLSVGTPGIDPEPGSEEQFLSNPQETITNERGTLKFVAKNSFNYFDVVFSTGAIFEFRCEGWIGRYQPKVETDTWVDQPLNMETNKAKPYREIPLNIGQKAGVADFVADQVNRLLAFDYCVVNGVQVTRPEDNELQPLAIPGWPNAVWTCVVRQTKNRNSIRVQNGNSPAEFFFVTYNLDTKLFGPLNAPPSSNPITIVAVE